MLSHNELNFDFDRVNKHNRFKLTNLCILTAIFLLRIQLIEEFFFKCFLIIILRFLQTDQFVHLQL